MPHDTILQYIDTCMPCYLQDHHNRPSELLLGVPVDNTTTYTTLYDDLLTEFASFAHDLNDTAFRNALDNCFADVADMDILFDPTLEPLAEDDEPCYAWFLITFNPKGAHNAQQNRQ